LPRRARVIRQRVTLARRARARSSTAEGSCELGGTQKLPELRLQLPPVLNTSFNSQEPMVCTPADAVRTFRGSGLDTLVLGRYEVDA
jgi:hypothetical protein